MLIYSEKKEVFTFEDYDSHLEGKVMVVFMQTALSKPKASL